jgi:predicted nucleic acid-binding protein
MTGTRKANPAAPGVASAFVLDAQVALSWCFGGDAGSYGDGVLDRFAEETALVPAVWSLDVGEKLLAAERSQTITRAQSLRFAELLRALPISVDNATAARAMEGTLALAREHGLTLHDAAYLELAIREGLPLATRNEALVEAARKCGVTVR